MDIAPEAPEARHAHVGEEAPDTTSSDEGEDTDTGIETEMNDDEKEYEVEKIMDVRLVGQEYCCQLKWKGYRKLSWAFEADLTKCRSLMRTFWGEWKGKPIKRVAGAASDLERQNLNINNWVGEEDTTRS